MYFLKLGVVHGARYDLVAINLPEDKKKNSCHDMEF